MHYMNVKGILSPTNGMNLCRGCTHGCIYCDSRSSCYNIDHDFEDVAIKQNAPQLLEDRLRRKRKNCMIGTGCMSDPYLHLETKLGLTRQCLQIIDHYGFGLAIQTKSDRILRDLNLLKNINNHSKCVVQMTLTTYDEALCKIIEPNVCTTKRRFEVLKILRDAGIPTIVWLDPILPYINDTEENIRGILNYCIEANVYGIICFNMGLTLREGNREYFYHKLDEHFPGMKARYQQRYGYSYEVISDKNESLMALFHQTCEQHGILHNNDQIFNYLHTYEEKNNNEQLSLF